MISLHITGISSAPVIIIIINACVSPLHIRIFIVISRVTTTWLRVTIYRRTPRFSTKNPVCPHIFIINSQIWIYLVARNGFLFINKAMIIIYSWGCYSLIWGWTLGWCILIWKIRRFSKICWIHYFLLKTICVSVPCLMTNYIRIIIVGCWVYVGHGRGWIGQWKCSFLIIINTYACHHCGCGVIRIYYIKWINI